MGWVQGWILCLHHYNCDQKHTDGNVEAAAEVSDEVIEATDEADSNINTNEMVESDENLKKLVQ